MLIDSNLSVVITGGASGLGEATARHFAARGARCALLDMNAERGEAVAQDIGGVFAACDVTQESDIVQAFAKVRAAQGHERVLINCAGTGVAVKTAGRDRETGALKPHPLKVFEKILAINLTGTFRCIVESATGMMTLEPVNADGERGVIINTASVAAEDGQVGQAAYAASKAGVVGMTLPIARDLAQEGIRINTILPGLFDTPLFAGAPEKVRQALAAQTPFPSRLGAAAEYASLAMEMCQNGMFNAASVRLDGAIRMAPR